MGARGTKSAAELSVISSEGIVSVTRPEPPAELTDEQATEWRAIVNSNAADRFPREMQPVLGAYCRHVVTLRHIAQLVSKAELADPFDEKLYDKRLAMQERESRCIASLAVRLGIAKTTAYEGKKPRQVRNPWEFKG